MNYAFYDKRILGWKYYQNTAAAISSSLGLRLLPSILTAVLVIVFVARILAVIDGRLELKAIQDNHTSFLQGLHDLVFIPTAYAAAPYDVKLDYSKEAVKLIQSAYDIETGTSEVFTFTVGFKNSGKKTWKDKGPEQMLIVSKSQQSNYELPTIYGSLREEVKPGWIGYFTIFVKAPDVMGTTKDEFVLLRSNKVISGSEFPLTYTVSKKIISVVAAPQPVAAACPAYQAASILTQDDCNSAPTNIQPAVVAAAGPTIRVGIFYKPEAQTFIADQPMTLKDASGKVLLNVSSGSTLSLDYIESEKLYSYSLNGEAKTSNSYLTIVPSDSNRPITISSYENRPGWKPSINDNTFLGNLEIRYNAPNDRTWIIDELALETYLKGTAEVGNDAPVEYLKAMSIAERTYALYHIRQNTKHASEFFTVDATYDQVYKGYGTQQRMNNLGAAIDATAGQVVTYAGNVAITPYFSWSDGHTRSMLEIWKVDKPWLQSVQEPEGYDKTTMFGHGVGLSARGAYILAHDFNKNYDQILKYYYTGIEVKSNYNQ